jgi:hypothetical protein
MKYLKIDPKYLRRCDCSQKRNTKRSIRNTSVGATVCKNEIPKDRSKIAPSVRLFAKTKYQKIDLKYLRRCTCSQGQNTKCGNRTREIEEAKIQLLSQGRRHCSQIQIKNEATGSKTGDAEIKTDHHARTKTSDRESRRESSPRREGHAR